MSEKTSGNIKITTADGTVIEGSSGDIGIVTEYEDDDEFRVEAAPTDFANWVGTEHVTLLAKVEDRADEHEYA